MKTITRFALVAGLAAATTANAGVNLLANGSFEDDITFDGPPFIGLWEGFSSGAPGTATSQQTLMPRSGNRHVELSILGDDNSFAGVFQDVNVTAGDMYTFSGWHMAVTPALNIGIEFRIEWRDSVNGTEVGRTPNETLAPTPGGGYEEFSLTAMALAGADTARVVYAIQTFGGDGDGSNTGTVYLDDFSFVPAPGTAALMALGGLAAARRRR